MSPAARGGGSTRTPARPEAAERARRIRAERAAQRRAGASGAEGTRRRDAVGAGRRDAVGAGRRDPGGAGRGRRGAATRPARGPLPRRIALRRRVAAVVAVLVLLGALAAGTWALLYTSGLAEVEGVEVTGLSTIAETDVLAAAAVEPGVPLVAVDTAGVARRVAQLPGVASVEVGRSWPHTVSVRVVERTPVALASTTLGLTLVDGTGVAYRAAPDPPPPLPRLEFATVGPGDPATGAALAVLAALPQAIRTQVETVDTDGPAVAPTVTLGLTERRQVVVGTVERLAEKAAVLGPLLTQDGSVYDVSSPDLPSIRR